MTHWDIWVSLTHSGRGDLGVEPPAKTCSWKLLLPPGKYWQIETKSDSAFYQITLVLVVLCVKTLQRNACLCGSLAQCALSLKRLSAGPGFNPQTRQNKSFQDYWRACFEIYFSDRQEGLTVSSII